MEGDCSGSSTARLSTGRAVPLAPAAPGPLAVGARPDREGRAAHNDRTHLLPRRQRSRTRGAAADPARLRCVQSGAGVHARHVFVRGGAAALHERGGRVLGLRYRDGALHPHAALRGRLSVAAPLLRHVGDAAAQARAEARHAHPQGARLVHGSRGAELRAHAAERRPDEVYDPGLLHDLVVPVDARRRRAPSSKRDGAAHHGQLVARRQPLHHLRPGHRPDEAGEDAAAEAARRLARGRAQVAADADVRGGEPGLGRARAQHQG
mmetsp:Transcript_25305/g.52919  ORF Transcript_25305/g.52919 Transcript_25305/m.52919 type:complete len:265 (+) Transcript_25305:903-1697(+)